MILVCTPNPSLDRTALIAGFAAGQIYRIGQPLELAGGKGFNVARVLHTLGEEVMVVGPLGGFVGEALLEQARDGGLNTETVAIAGGTRTCLSIVDRDLQQVTELYEEGPILTTSEWSAVADVVDRHLVDATLLMIAGSFPRGVPDDALRDLIERAGTHGVPAWVDGHGLQLTRALDRRPALVKVNRVEAEGVTGRPVVDLDSALAAAGDIRARGAAAAVVTLGDDGAAGVDDLGTPFAWAPPAIDAISAVGSGDAFFAGMAAGFVRGEALDAATRRGVAHGAANAVSLGAGIVDPAVAAELLPLVVRLV